MSLRSIQIKHLARVEGEGGFAVRVDTAGKVTARFTITEAPRLFEGILQHRHGSELPDITARICGICPVAHQLSAAAAIEAASGIVMDAATVRLRRLLLCGEWLESHALHVTLLHAPDFYGVADGLTVGTIDPAALQRGLAMKKLGNEIVARIGGREIHPVNVCIGGFHRWPRRSELAPLEGALREGLEAALATVRWAAELRCPDFETDCEFVALREAVGYPMIADRLASGSGLRCGVADFERHFENLQVRHSTALHHLSRSGAPFMVGPLARFNLHCERLSPKARRAASASGLAVPCRNPFKSILVRAVEMVHACETAMELLRDAHTPGNPSAVPLLGNTAGSGAVEAPRGLLLHRYTLDENGLVRQARIFTPTAMNQAVVEDDLKALAEQHSDLPRDRLTRLLEQAVRNFDPCISCATH
jgi:coenzyme F420-reducing hydrogenase alpha subunit